MLKRIIAGQGRAEDLGLLLDVANRIEGHTICALGDAAAWPVQSFLKHFGPEFQYMIEHKGRSMVDGAPGPGSPLPGATPGSQAPAVAA
jgi:NADH-quinone oxidoreductase subunit F